VFAGCRYDPPAWRRPDNEKTVKTCTKRRKERVFDLGCVCGVVGKGTR
jgi:hypothetical protein